MNWIVSLIKSSMLRWWFMITTIYTMSSTCPCCGNPACPGGIGGGAVISGVLVLVAKGLSVVKRGVKKSSQCNCNGKCGKKLQMLNFKKA